MSDRARFRRAGLIDPSKPDHLTAYEEVLECAWGDLDGMLPISKSGRELFVKVERRVDSLHQQGYYEPMDSFQMQLWRTADIVANPSASYHDEMYPKELQDTIRLAWKLMAQAKLLGGANQFGFASGTARWLWTPPKQRAGRHPDAEFPRSRFVDPPG